MSKEQKPLAGRMPPIQDRRAHSRVSVTLPCEIRSGGLVRRGTLVHLSLSGAFISSGHIPASGEEVTIVVPSRGRTGSFTLTGKVVRSGYHFSAQGGSRGFGIHFQRAGSDLLTLIKEAVNSPGYIPGPDPARNEPA